MKILIFILASVLLLPSCTKEIAAPSKPYIWPLITDELFRRAYYFTFRRWGDAAVVSHTDSSLTFEIDYPGRHKDSVNFKKRQADIDARLADSSIFYDQRDRPEIPYRVRMYFTYILFDTVSHQIIDLSYSYRLSDTLFCRY